MSKEEEREERKKKDNTDKPGPVIVYLCDKCGRRYTNPGSCYCGGTAS